MRQKRQRLAACAAASGGKQREPRLPAELSLRRLLEHRRRARACWGGGCCAGQYASSSLETSRNPPIPASSSDAAQHEAEGSRVTSAAEKTGHSHALRSACACGSMDGMLRETGSQDCVFCARCGKFQYNAPRTETGKPVRSVRSSRDADIAPSLRAEIIVVRAGCHCELCGASDRELHVGHLISLDAGRREGMNEDDLNGPENLAAMCNTCNLGLGNQPVPLRLMIGLVMARTRRAAKGSKR